VTAPATRARARKPINDTALSAPSTFGVMRLAVVLLCIANAAAFSSYPNKYDKVKGPSPLPTSPPPPLPPPPPPPSPVNGPMRPEIVSEGGLLEAELHLGLVEYQTPTLTQSLIGYNGIVGGPTLRVEPGDQLRLTVFNELPVEACSTFHVEALWNTDHAPYHTSLHVHGLHVSNHENDILNINIAPGDSHLYIINIPRDHQGGTHWYHPHPHGATALQAGGGALGFIIVEDLPSDLPPEVLHLPELPLAIQLINMTYLQTEYGASYLKGCQAHCVPADKRGQCGEIIFGEGPTAGSYNNDLTKLAPDGMEYETLLLNGVEQPVFDIAAGQWYRLRLLFVPTRGRTLEPQLSGCDWHLIAKDGKYIKDPPRPVHSGYMVSGSRADFLIRCHQPGSYSLVSLSESATSSHWEAGATQKPPSLARIGPDAMATFQVHDTMKKMVAAIPFFSPRQPCYLADLTQAIPDHVSYLLQSGKVPPEYEGQEQWAADRPGCCTNISYYAINEDPFSITFLGPGPAEYLHDIPVGAVWEVDYLVPQVHPLHMHINSFQIIELPAMDTHEDYFQVGDYQDIVQIPIAVDSWGKAVLRSNIDRFTGEMLLHCHIYRHSDRGMAVVLNVTGEEGGVNKVLPECQGKSD